MFNFVEKILSQQHHLIFWMTAVFFGVCFGNFSLLYLRSVKKGKIKKWFHIPSPKSKTRALLLGGLPMNIGLTSAIWLISYGHRIPLTNQSRHVMQIFVYIFLGVLVYGYIDDRYEVRPVIKLIFQFMINVVLGLLVARYFYQENSALAFITICILSTAVMNGQNLLDGLDTLAVKLSFVNFSYFFALGLFYQIHSVKIISLLGLSAMAAFYFFNRSPAKLYLGEIGSVTLGLSFIMLGIEVFINLRYKESAGVWRGLSFAMAPSMMALMELAISFSRRFLYNQSPFRGDRLHLHYILQDKFSLRAHEAATAMMFFQMAAMASALISMMIYSIVFPLFIEAAFILMTSFFLAKEYWWRPWEFIGRSDLRSLLMRPKAQPNQRNPEDAVVLAFKKQKDAQHLNDAHVVDNEQTQEKKAS